MVLPDSWERGLQLPRLYAYEDGSAHFPLEKLACMPAYIDDAFGRRAQHEEQL